MAKDVDGNEKTYRVVLRDFVTVLAQPDPNWAGAPELEPRVSRQTWRSMILAADYFTVEPSGAVTFWIRSEDRERSALIAAFGRDEWKSIELAS